MLLRLYDLETNRKANLFKRYLGSWGYYNLDPAQLRSNLATPMDRVLDATGSNLCSVLYTLHNERPRDEKKLIEAAKLVEPRLDLISFQAPDPEHVYMFFEDSQNHKFGVQKPLGRNPPVPWDVLPHYCQPPGKPGPVRSAVGYD